jgi:anti-sigma B factor antagonist
MTQGTNGAAITVEVSDDGVIVVVGDIDMASGPQVDAAILRCEDETPLVIDLAGVAFIDSSGLRCLLGASRRAAGRNTTVVLRFVGPEVSRLLEITGTSEQFVIESNRD